MNINLGTYIISFVICRIYIAALHFNENGSRQQATTREGEAKWKMSYPKAKKGKECVVKPQKIEATFGKHIAKKKLNIQYITCT